MQDKINRVLYMSSAEWTRLEQLAVETDSREPAGRGHDPRVAPTWQRLIRRIAGGEFTLVERNPYRLPAGLADQAAEVEERQREQERIVQHRQRVEQHTVAKQAVRKTPPVKMTQLSMLELEPA